MVGAHTTCHCEVEYLRAAVLWKPNVFDPSAYCWSRVTVAVSVVAS